MLHVGARFMLIACIEIEVAASVKQCTNMPANLAIALFIPLSIVAFSSCVGTSFFSHAAL